MGITSDYYADTPAIPGEIRNTREEFVKSLQGHVKHGGLINFMPRDLDVATVLEDVDSYYGDNVVLENVKTRETLKWVAFNADLWATADTATWSGYQGRVPLRKQVSTAPEAFGVFRIY